MATIPYDFTVNNLEGPLVGKTFTGFFSYDDESEPVGFGYGSEEFFLTDFKSSFNGVKYGLDDVTTNFSDVKPKEAFWVGNVFPEWGSNSLALITENPVGIEFGSSIFLQSQPEFTYGNVGSGVGVNQGKVTYTLKYPINIVEKTINGRDGTDCLIGSPGNDQLNGKNGNDVLIGLAGNDILDGGNNCDILIGVNPLSVNPGRSEIDILNGGSGSDRFVLGGINNVYYDNGNPNTQGLGDYALIKDFENVDTIQLKGTSNDYLLNNTFTIGYKTGTAIFLKDNVNELIGFVEGVTDLNLNSSNFSFVNLAVSFS